MLIISKHQVENLIQRLNTPAELGQCRDEVRKMLEIKSALLWRVENGPQGCGCCGQLCRGWELEAYLAGEVQILEDILDTLEEGNISRASSLLRDYMDRLE